MIMLRKLLFSVLGCAFVSMAFAQLIRPRFETLGVNEGLSQSSVYAVLQDKAGFMWFGTADGLNRYDGSTIRVFKNKQTLSLAGNSNFIRGKLCEDANSNIWFTTESGLYYFDRQDETLKTAWLFPEQPSGVVYFYLVSIDHQQNLWLLDKASGMICYERTTGRITRYPYTFSLPPYAFNNAMPSVDKGGNIWINLFTGTGLCRFDVRTHRYQPLFAGTNFMQVFFGEKKAYLLTDKQVFRYDSLSARWDSLPLGFTQTSAACVQDGFVDSFQRLWVPGLNQGLFCFDFNHRQTSRFRYESAKQNSLASDNGTVLGCDRSGNLWVGTDGGGVSKLDLKPSRFNLFPLNEGDHSFLRDYLIKCLYEDEQGRIWFGTNSSGFGIYDPASGEVKHYPGRKGRPFALPSNQVSAFFRDREGRMWIGTGAGIFLFDKQRQRFIPVANRFPTRFSESSPFVYRFFERQNGNLIVASSHGLLAIEKQTDGYAARRVFQHNKPQPWPIDVVETPDARLWVACPLSGLYGHQSVSAGDSGLFPERYFPGLELRSLHRDETDPFVLWVASGKGLIRFDTRTRQFSLFNEDAGLANSFVYGVLEDESHHLWLSTNGGLSYFNQQKKTFQNYVAKDGLQSNEFNTGAFHKGASGTFYFGGIRGFNWFRQISRPQQTKPPVAITAIRVNDQLLSPQVISGGQQLSLAFDQSTLDISFAVLDFTRPAANKIQYHLEGVDKAPVITDVLHVRYPRLPPGTYTLRVKGINATDVWGDEKQLSITVLAPFWQQGWFYALLGALLLLVAVVITRNVAQRRLRRKLREVEKQRAIEAERNRISKDMHDEIGSGLTHIALLSELMLAQQKDEKALRKDVGAIALSARRLVQSMSEIVWALNPHNDTLENLLAYLREQTVSYFEPFDISYSVSFPADVPLVRFSNEERRNLFLVVKEALHNALKHAGASCIALEMQLSEQTLHFYIRDNGKGVDASRRRSDANGLRNMQRRMQEIGGFFELLTGAGGTAICLSLSLNNAARSRTTFFTWRRKRQTSTFEYDDLNRDHRG